MTREAGRAQYVSMRICGNLRRAKPQRIEGIERTAARLSAPPLCGQHLDLRRVTMKKPSVGALLLALIPFAAMCFSVSLWDRIDPMLFGIPFNLFWLISWIGLSPVCMWGAYQIETARREQDGHGR